MELLPKSVEEGLARLREGELFLGVRLLVHDKDDELMEFIGHNDRFYFTSFHSNFKNESQINSSLTSDVQYRRAPRAHVISFAVAQPDGVALAEVFKLNIMLPFKDVKRTTMVDKGDLLRYVRIINNAYDDVLTQLARDRMMSEDAIEEYVRENAPGIYNDEQLSSSSSETKSKSVRKPVYYVASSSSSETRRKRKRTPRIDPDSRTRTEDRPDKAEDRPAKARPAKARPAKARPAKARPAKARSEDGSAKARPAKARAENREPPKSKAKHATSYDSDDSLQEILRGMT